MNGWKLAAGSFLLLAPAIAAQRAGISDPLELPRFMLACQNLRADVADSTGPESIVVMTESEPSVFIRNIVGAYDSTGRAMFLRIALERKTQGDTSEIIVASFDRNLAVDGVRALALNMIDDGPPTAGTDEEPRLLGPFIRLSTEDANRARHLAEWVWNRRCEPHTALSPPD